MKKLNFIEHVFCYITLGLLCGWYQFLLVIVPPLIYFSFKGSYIAGSILAVLVILTKSPLSYGAPWKAFSTGYMFQAWIRYFDMTFDIDLNLEKGKKYMFLEFPHGIFPMGQFLSVCGTWGLWEDQVICGTGADVIFGFPVMRQILTWMGTFPASRKNITKIFDKGFHCAIIPGGIAEMYLTNDRTEAVYFKKRTNTIKAAIQEGANIVPIMFFGNSKLFKILDGQGSDSWIAKLSRKVRASIVLFYGRNYLPVPFRHPLKMVTGEVVEVKQSDNPTVEYIEEIHQKVIKSLEKIYETKKPDWETRPLVIH